MLTHVHLSPIDLYGWRAIGGFQNVFEDILDESREVAQ
jgi:hypothetical protein